MNAFYFFLGLILLFTVVPAVWLSLFLLACRCIRVEYGTASSNKSSVLEITRRSGGYFRTYVFVALVWDEPIVEVSMETQFLRFISRPFQNRPQSQKRIGWSGRSLDCRRPSRLKSHRGQRQDESLDRNPKGMAAQKGMIRNFAIPQAGPKCSDPARWSTNSRMPEHQSWGQFRWSAAYTLSAGITICPGKLKINGE